MKVIVNDACKYAEFLHPLAKLPRARQWDKAAGRFDLPEDHGPFVGTWDAADDPDGTRIAVLRTFPLAAGTATQDISIFCCRDMSGNGLELTRDVNGDQEAPLESAGPGDNITLRGTSYENPEPLLFKYLKNPEDTRYPGQPRYNSAVSLTIGFRVVLEPNSP
jgi:hypothetical protein